MTNREKKRRIPWASNLIFSSILKDIYYLYYITIYKFK